MTARIKYTDPTADQTRPNNEGIYTIKDYEWLLNRFTSKHWSVAECKFYNHNQNILACTLKAKLKHESGSLLRIIPKDSTPKRAGRPMKTVHRIYLTNRLSDNSCTVLTLDTNSDIKLPTTIETPDGPYASTCTSSPNEVRTIKWNIYQNTQTHPHPKLNTALKTASRSYIHSVQDDLEYKPNIIKRLPDVLLTAFGGTQQVSNIYQSQPTLKTFQET